MWEPQPLATLRASTACIGITLPYLNWGAGSGAEWRFLTLESCILEVTCNRYESSDNMINVSRVLSVSSGEYRDSTFKNRSRLPSSIPLSIRYSWPSLHIYKPLYSYLTINLIITCKWESVYNDFMEMCIAKMEVKETPTILSEFVSATLRCGGTW
jgi:hypothetical protein